MNNNTNTEIFKNKKIFIVEDNIELLNNLQKFLLDYFDEENIITSLNKKDAIKEIKKCSFDIAILDISLTNYGKNKDGFEIYHKIRESENHKHSYIIFFTNHDSKENLMETNTYYNVNFISKLPFSFDVFINIIKQGLILTDGLKEKAEKEKQISSKKLSNIIGKSKQIEKIKETIIYSNNYSNIYIYGETGTGKELVARALHQISERKGDFIAINCATIQDNLFESEMFGYVKGAFTGANKDKDGAFIAANNGTLFLDEIGDLSENNQAKLLRAVEENSVKRLGSNKEEKINITIISASNKDIKKMVREEKFREDLFNRLQSIRIEIPPLRERKEDIELLANEFIKQHNFNNNENKSISKKGLERLKQYTFKGNVRELQNIIINAYINSRDKKSISEKHIIDAIKNVSNDFKFINNQNIKNLIINYFNKDSILNVKDIYLIVFGSEKPNDSDRKKIQRNLNELIDEGIIERAKRGIYKLKCYNYMNL